MSAEIRAGGSNKITNDVILGLVKERITPGSRLLDFSAGQGHMSSRVGEYLLGQGVDPKDHLYACDISPEKFIYDRIECRKNTADSNIPFEDGYFDIIYAIEVVEHLPRPYDFFNEAYRKLKPGGHLIFSAPNMLHMQSRLKFFFTGFAEMFGPLSTEDKNAGRVCGHIMPLNYSHFHYGLKKARFRGIKLSIDRRKRSAKFLACLFYPLLRLGSKITDRDLEKYDREVWAENREVVYKVNSFDVLTSRSCIIAAQK